MPQTGSVVRDFVGSTIVILVASFGSLVSSSQQHILSPCSCTVADARANRVLQLASPTGAIETFVLGTRTTDSRQLLRHGFPCPVQSHRSVVGRCLLGLS